MSSASPLSSPLTSTPEQSSDALHQLHRAISGASYQESKHLHPAKMVSISSNNDQSRRKAVGSNTSTIGSRHDDKETQSAPERLQSGSQSQKGGEEKAANGDEGSKPPQIPRPRKGSNLRERVLHMTPSWFTVTMGE